MNCITLKDCHVHTDKTIKELEKVFIDLDLFDGVTVHFSDSSIRKEAKE